MALLREKVRNIILSAELNERVSFGLSTLKIIKVPLSAKGDVYYYVDNLLRTVKYREQGNRKLDLIVLESADRIARPYGKGIADWSEAVDFSLEKELLAKRYTDKYGVRREIDQFLEDLRKESKLSKGEWATASLIASPVLSKKVRKKLGNGGAVIGGLIGILTGGIYGPLTLPIGALTGYAFGAMSPIIASGLFIHHKKKKRRSRIQDALREGNKLQDNLISITQISKKVLELPSSNIDNKQLFNDAFPMDDNTPLYPHDGVSEKAILDVLACDIDGYLELTPRARAYYWRLFDKINWGGYPASYYRDAAEILGKYKPRDRIELRSSSTKAPGIRKLRLVDPNE